VDLPLKVYNLALKKSMKCRSGSKKIMHGKLVYLQLVLYGAL
jgi:hypothetical protein